MGNYLVILCIDKLRIIRCPSNFTTKYIRIESKMQINICAEMFTAAFFTIAKRWTLPKYSSTDEWINQLWYCHIIKKYSAIKEMNY